MCCVWCVDVLGVALAASFYPGFSFCACATDGRGAPRVASEMIVVHVTEKGLPRGISMCAVHRCPTQKEVKTQT